MEAEHLSLWALCEGNLEGDSFTGDPEGYVKKALETGTSLQGAPLGNLEGGSFTRDFEGWIKGALRVERLSLRELSEGNLVGGLHYWGPWKICRKESGEGHLHRDPVGEPGRDTGDVER